VNKKALCVDNGWLSLDSKTLLVDRMRLSVDSKRLFPLRKPRYAVRADVAGASLDERAAAAVVDSSRMNRTDLEQLDRDTLVARAEAAGVTRARILTRPELVDELLLRSSADPVTKQRSRGLFGVARDLVARVVEQGLHLPDAADRIRTLGGFAGSRRPSAPAALPTVTLAEIYAAQGHRDRAIETLEGVLGREPDHAVAGALLAQLRDSTFPIPPPRMPPEADDERPALASDSLVHDTHRAPAGPEHAEPFGMLDDAPLPPRYEVDECVAIPVDPRTLYVYWEARDSTLAYLRTARGGGALVLRLIVVEPTWDGPRSSNRDHEVGSSVGDYFVRDLPGGCVVRAAIGWKHGEAFVPIAHSPALETPPGAPSPLLADVLVRWTPKGPVPLTTEDRDAVAIQRALGRARREAADARRAALGGGLPGAIGSSQEWARGL
jgi:hypothetical protein